MRQEERTDVLVVGAGPVGLWTALELAERGIRVKIIDREETTAVHGYVCALHRSALRVLADSGLAAEVIRRGRPVETVAFYEGRGRRAQIQFRASHGELPFIVTLPQHALEELLVERLRAHAHVQVNWNQRLAGLREDGAEVVADIDHLGFTSKGYSVPHMESVVQRTRSVRASFVIGADGPNSPVRQLAGIDSERLGQPSLFAFYDFEPDGPLSDEIRMVLDATTASCLWPMPGQQARWAFQLNGSAAAGADPGKDRENFVVEDAAEDHQARESLQRLLVERAPWFDLPVRELRWHRTLQFETRLVTRFGRGRCWLVGGAAHQACPLAMQSVNVGLCEGRHLAGILADILQHGAPLDRLDKFDRSRHAEWRQLLGLERTPKPRSQVDPWIRQHSGRFLSCLPASGEDLPVSASQLDLELATPQTDGA